MTYYIKQLEIENEELRQRLAKEELNNEIHKKSLREIIPMWSTIFDKNMCIKKYSLRSMNGCIVFCDLIFIETRKVWKAKCIEGWNVCRDNIELEWSETELKDAKDYILKYTKTQLWGNDDEYIHQVT